MSQVIERNMLLLLGIVALVLVAVTQHAHARKATLAKTAEFAHSYYACGSRGGKRCQARPRTSEETEQLLLCLFRQPFVTCDGVELDPQRN